MNVNLEGMFFALNNNIPVLLKIDTKLYLPLFSDITKLNNAIKRFKIKYTSVKQINNPTEFLEDTAKYKELVKFSIITDLNVNESGNIVFNLITE